MLTSLENQKTGDPALALDDPLSDDQSFYVIEARDSDAPFGAPDSFAPYRAMVRIERYRPSGRL